MTEAMGTDLEDAEDLLRRQRARLDACVDFPCRLAPCRQLPSYDARVAVSLVLHHASEVGRLF